MYIERRKKHGADANELKIMYEDKFPVKEICGEPVLVADELRDIKDYLSDVYLFDARFSQDITSEDLTLEDSVVVDRCDTILAKKDLLEDKRKEVDVFRRIVPDNDIVDNEEVSTINDFIHKDDEEYEVIIEEHVSTTIKVKARDEDEPLIIAKEMYDGNYVDTSNGTVQDVLLSVEDHETGDFGDFHSIYNIY